MSLEIKGRLVVKYDTQQVSEKFKKREFVIEINEEINGYIYTNFGKFQLVQNKCDIIDRFFPGDMLKVNFNVKGNKYERDGKTTYITNLDAWRIEKVAGSTETYNAPPSPANSAPFTPSPEQIDDLPF